jgi:hypothetical protein
MPQGTEHFRQALGFIDGKPARVRIQESFQVRSKHSEVGRPFEIEVSPIRENVPRKGTLSALPGPNKKDGGERPEEEMKTIGTKSVDKFHAL